MHARKLRGQVARKVCSKNSFSRKKLHPPRHLMWTSGILNFKVFGKSTIWGNKCNITQQCCLEGAAFTQRLYQLTLNIQQDFSARVGYQATCVKCLCGALVHTRVSLTSWFDKQSAWCYNGGPSIRGRVDAIFCPTVNDIFTGKVCIAQAIQDYRIFFHHCFPTRRQANFS